MIISGQDVVLDILANYLHQENINAGRTYLSSFEGLLALYQGKVDAAACHLYDGKECNASFVRSLMPGVSAVLVNLSYRTQGFYVLKSNPKHITGWEDLRRADISILNRRVGSSSRILLDTQLKKTGNPLRTAKGLRQDYEFSPHDGICHCRRGCGSCHWHGADNASAGGA